MLRSMLGHLHEAGQDLEESAKQKQCSMKLYNSVYMYTVH